VKRVADSLALAILNVLVVAFSYATDVFHLNVPYLLVVIALPLTMLLTLVTLVFTVRDLLNSASRTQGSVALVLTLPICYVFFLVRW
jgi:hypothetical protein